MPRFRAIPPPGVWERRQASTVADSQSRRNRGPVNGPSTPVDLLVPPSLSSYPLAVAVDREPASHRTFVAVAVVVLLVTALVLVLFVRTHQRVLDEAFFDRSTAYAQAFAASARPWINVADVSMLQAASHFLLVGSALFVQVASGGELLIDERTSAAQEATLDLVRNAAPLFVAEQSLPSGESYLDIVVVIEDGETSSASYVRIGIDRASVAVQLRGTMLVSSGIAVGIDVLLLGMLAWALLGRPRRTPFAPEGRGAVLSPKPIEVGPLRIHPHQKRVTLAGRPVRLTPKQFALLQLLATRPGDVFSEKEILDVAWPDSPYADAKDIKQYIYLLRRRLSKVRPDGRDLIVTVPGFGYKMVDAFVDEEMTD